MLPWFGEAARQRLTQVRDSGMLIALRGCMCTSTLNVLMFMLTVILSFSDEDQV